MAGRFPVGGRPFPSVPPQSCPVVRRVAGLYLPCPHRQGKLPGRLWGHTYSPLFPPALFASFPSDAAKSPGGKGGGTDLCEPASPRFLREEFKAAKRVGALGFPFGHKERFAPLPLLVDSAGPSSRRAGRPGLSNPIVEVGALGFEPRSTGILGLRLDVRVLAPVSPYCVRSTRFQSSPDAKDLFRWTYIVTGARKDATTPCSHGNAAGAWGRARG